MSATLSLDKFQLMWLCEGFIGRSHLRWDGYPMMVNDVYPQLSDGEREFLYTYLKRDTSWHWEKPTLGDETPMQYWKRMLARYNPSNQYVVTLKKGREKQQVTNAYLFDGKYYIGWQQYCAPEYIKKVERRPFKKCNNPWCASRTRCLRALEYNNGDETFRDGNFTCEKCDFLIEKTE